MNNYTAVCRYRESPKGKFARAKESARHRGVVWALTFDQWWDIWHASGKWSERGGRPGTYCMSRHEDMGPYAPSNVYIAPFVQNLYEGRTRRYHTAKTMTVVFDGAQA